MDELKKWAKDKPKFLVMLAFTLVKASDSFHVILKDRGHFRDGHTI